MIGSPDVLAFTSEDGFGDGYSDPYAVPEDLFLPLFPSTNPWSNTSRAKFNRDFILVAEFSEQVGPLPVLTVPADPRVYGSFDLNQFSLRIMSVDYQASSPGPSSQYSGPRLSFNEDSQVVMGNSKEGAFAYVHHLTLYDLEARGFVRPFCMAYVSSEQRKIMEQFQELSLRFGRASESLKTGNRRAFAQELHRKLRDLEFTRSHLQKQEGLLRAANESAEEGEAELQKIANELASVERSVLEHRDLLRQVTSYPNRKLKDPDFLPYDPVDDSSDLLSSLTPDPRLLTLDPPSPSYTPQLVAGRSAKHFDRHLKPLQELSDRYFLDLMLEQLGATERYLRGDQSVLHTVRITHTLSRKHPHTNFLFELWDQEEEEEEEEEGEEGGAGLKGAGCSGMLLPVAVCDAQGPPGSMDSFFSCVEEVQIKLEMGSRGGAWAPEPEVEGEGEVATEMIESVSSGDSIEVLGTERSYRTQGVAEAGDVREMSGEMVDVRRFPVDLGFRRMRTLARRANSEDSIEVLSTTDSIFPDDLTAITEEESEDTPPQQHRTLGNEVQEEEESEDTPPQQRRTLGNEVQEEEESEDTPPQQHSTLGNEVHEKEESEDTPLQQCKTLGNEVQEEETPGSDTPPDSDTPPQHQETLVQECAAEEGHLANGGVTGQRVPPLRRVPDLRLTFTPPVILEPLPLSELGRWSLSDAPCRLNVDEASDCASYITASPSSSEPPSFTPRHHGNPRPRRRRRAGLGALRFLRQNSFSQHAVFCLLSGRPLVVIGGEENYVRKVVAALSLYLPAPGRYGDAVQPCLARPLQLTDLLTWRLIGIHRSSSTPTPGILHPRGRYGRYVALLDLDQRTLCCPPYRNTLIGRLANPRTLISRGSTYLLHLESCLTALAAKAFLYTFSHTLHLPINPGDDYATLAKRRRDFLLGRGSSGEDDLKVMYFLSDLIKQRHSGSSPPVLSFSYGPAPLHRNIIT